MFGEVTINRLRREVYIDVKGIQPVEYYNETSFRFAELGILRCWPIAQTGRI